MPYEDRWWEREKKEQKRGKELIEEAERRITERTVAIQKGKVKQYDKKHGIRPA